MKVLNPFCVFSVGLLFCVGLLTACSEHSSSCGGSYSDSQIGKMFWTFEATVIHSDGMSKAESYRRWLEKVRNTEYRLFDYSEHSKTCFESFTEQGVGELIIMTPVSSKPSGRSIMPNLNPKYIECLDHSDNQNLRELSEILSYSDELSVQLLSDAILLQAADEDWESEDFRFAVWAGIDLLLRFNIWHQYGS